MKLFMPTQQMQMLMLIQILSLWKISDSASVKSFEGFWVDPMQVLEELDDYRALWVKPHGCVWSECAVDDTDDGYTGDNRDGDEQWYQYRTQEFCANAAYSLYGLKKGDFGTFSCTRGHFINSFFTYGGADNLLLALGKSPNVYYDNGDGYSTNADCVELENQDEGNNNNEHRELSGDHNDENAVTSTMGCSVDGEYRIASFQANNCNGNYYIETLDFLQDYNRQHEHMGCHKIYSNLGHTPWGITYLMNNSWTCDLDLYPNGCPDPYGVKARYDVALRSVAHGKDPQRAYRSMVLKRPLHILSVFLLLMGAFLVVFTYYVKNRERMTVSKGGGAKGFFRCIVEDIGLGFAAIIAALRQQVAAMREARRNRAEGRRKKRKSKRDKESGKSGKSERKKKKKKKSDRYTAEVEDDGYLQVEAPSISLSGEFS
eukprot:Nitzschia sp. Nitz4//scaffold103_size77763//36823//38202//NITZ4_005444-RA/size77763-snap-gene-0.52-mRNA-1//1//CDS//3329532325//5526//frame0